jgi:hypothetical protein
MHLAHLPAGFNIRSHNRRMSLLELQRGIERWEHQAAELLEMPNEDQCEKLAVLRDISNTWVTEIWVRHAEDHLI